MLVFPGGRKDGKDEGAPDLVSIIKQGDHFAHCYLNTHSRTIAVIKLPKKGGVNNKAAVSILKIKKIKNKIKNPFTFVLLSIRFLFAFNTNRKEHYFSYTSYGFDISR